MGAFLHIGIVKNYKIEKYSLSRVSNDIYEALNKLDGRIPLDLYEIRETEKHLILDLKREVFNKENLIDFLEEQYEKFNPYNKEEALNKVREISKIENIIEVLEDDGCLDLYTIDDVMFFNVKGEEFRCELKAVVYLSDGKFLMEEFDNVFKYFRHSIRMSSNKPLVKTVELFIL